MAQHEYPLIDVDDYLTLDRASKEKRYEFVDGELRMLAGGSTYHSRITLNLASTLHSLLSETSCYVYSSDILHTFGPESTVKLESLNVSFPIDVVYRGMNLTGTRNYNSKKS